MRLLKVNLKPFWYATFKSKEPIKDSDGKRTGEYKTVYNTPVEVLGNISVATGEAQVETFGTSVPYNKVIFVEGTNIPISETTVLCVDVPVTYDSENSLIYDYVVSRVARSLTNHTLIAIKRVDVK